MICLLSRHDEVRIAITGARGQLGRTLCRRLADYDVLATDIEEMDIRDPSAVDSILGEFRPEVTIHCAAMTDVDKCETEKELAFALNAEGTANVARACAAKGSRLITISTDYIFSGELGRPYNEDDEPGPRTVYGASKLEGERLVRKLCPDHVILRVAWLYGPGGPSFVKTMLKLLREEGKPLKVVDDQIGNPTSTDAAVDVVAELLSTPFTGTMHCTCEGEATWFEFADAIREQTGAIRELLPCTSEEFPRPAPRPQNSRLDNRVLRQSGLPQMLPWRDALAQFLASHPEG